MTDGVVQWREDAAGIVWITMQDRVNKNTFSAGLVRGLAEAFASVERSSTSKVVVLTGFDSYFACGGTQEGLLSIQDRTTKFTDSNLYRLPLDCSVPVIAAMQGHGIGGGLVLGLFADLIVMSRESVYTANFMKYGFTPGMGATCVLPWKLGTVLAHELLFTAGNYRGADLEARGAPFPIVARAGVLALAEQRAREIAEKPRVSLVTLKEHLVRGMRTELTKVVEQELAMHDVTFTQPEVRERIRMLFGN